MYPLRDNPDKGIIALREQSGWLYCERLLKIKNIHDAGPFTEEEFFLVFEVMSEPAWVESIDMDFPPTR
jgi:hypothetical protein